MNACPCNRSHRFTPAALPLKSARTSSALGCSIRPSLIDDVHSARGRLKEEGYLFLPGYLDRDEVLERPPRSDRSALDRPGISIRISNPIDAVAVAELSQEVHD